MSHPGKDLPGPLLLVFYSLTTGLTASLVILLLSLIVLFRPCRRCGYDCPCTSMGC